MTPNALFNPRSICVVGASERPSLGRSIVAAASALGFDGAVYPVNPRYEQVLGHRCYTSLTELPQAPDAVAICVGAARVLDTVRQAAARGARGIVIFDGGFAEHGGEGAKLQAAIVDICREAGIALCGPNCMGVLNPVNRSSVYMQAVRDPSVLAGNVALVSQSGSICISMLGDLSRYGFSHVVSSGNEAVVDTAHYIDALVDDPATKIIATFSESIKHPERYVAALDRAAAASKPVVVLKVGRSERGRRAIMSHTGGLAGEARVFSSVLKAHRAIEVFDLHEMIEVLAAFQAKRLPTGRGISVITASGGQAELLLDLAAANGLELPPLPPEQRAEVERVIGPVTGDGNPLDAWGGGDVDTNMPLAFEVLDAAPNIHAVVFCNDTADHQPMGREGLMDRYTELTARFAKASKKPHYMLKTRPGVMNAKQVAALRREGVPIVEGIGPGLAAIDRLARYATSAAPPLIEAACVAAPEPRITRSSVNEVDAKRMLSEFGVPVVQETLCATEAQALAAAETIGYPVVLKAVSDDIPHKSEYGLVAVNLADRAALSRAWTTLQTRAAEAGVVDRITGHVVQQMVIGGVEVFAGVTRDPEFGQVLAFGLGGIMIEVLRDFALRPLPLREGDAASMVREIQSFAMLDGARGSPVADVPALVGCLDALARFAHAHRAWIAEIDLNPIKVLPSGQGCVAVDALITPQPRMH